METCGVRGRRLPGLTALPGLALGLLGLSPRTPRSAAAGVHTALVLAYLAAFQAVKFYLHWHAIRQAPELDLTEYIRVIRDAVYVASVCIFIWSFFNKSFIETLRTLSTLKSLRHNYIQLNLCLLILTCGMFFLSFYKNEMYVITNDIHSQAKRYEETLKFLSPSGMLNLAFVLNVHISTTWLELFMYLSSCYLAALFLSIREELTLLNQDLLRKVVSGDIYRPGSFSKWRCEFQRLLHLIERLNEATSSYLLFLVMTDNLGLMLTMFNTSAACDSGWEVLFWMCRFGVPLLVLTGPAVQASQQGEAVGGIIQKINFQVLPPNTLAEINAFLATLQSAPVAFTAGSVFSVDMAAFRTMVGTLVAYWFVVKQFTDEKRQHCVDAAVASTAAYVNGTTNVSLT